MLKSSNHVQNIKMSRLDYTTHSYGQHSQNSEKNVSLIKARIIDLGTIMWVANVLEIVLPYLTIKILLLVKSNVVKQIQLNNIIKGIVTQKWTC